MRQVTSFIPDSALTRSIPFLSQYSHTPLGRSPFRLLLCYFLRLLHQTIFSCHNPARFRCVPHFLIVCSLVSMCQRLVPHLRLPFAKSMVICLLSHFLAYVSLIEVASRCHAFDYSGIIILIVGSFFPAIYYGFFCDTHLKILYLTGISIAGLGEFKL